MQIPYGSSPLSGTNILFEVDQSISVLVFLWYRPFVSAAKWCLQGKYAIGFLYFACFL